MSNIKCDVTGLLSLLVSFSVPGPGLQLSWKVTNTLAELCVRSTCVERVNTGYTGASLEIVGMNFCHHVIWAFAEKLLREKAYPVGSSMFPSVCGCFTFFPACVHSTTQYITHETPGLTEECYTYPLMGKVVALLSFLKKLLAPTLSVDFCYFMGCDLEF